MKQNLQIDKEYWGIEYAQPPITRYFDYAQPPTRCLSVVEGSITPLIIHSL